MAIDFKCPSCNSTIRVSDNNAGRKGMCPSCKAPIRVPGTANKSSAEKAVSGAEATPAAKSGAAPKVESAAFIKFACPSCGKNTGFPANLAGSTAPCPICAAQIMVPQVSGGESFVVGAPTAPAGATGALEAAQQQPLPSESKTPPWFYAAGGAAVAIIAVSLLILVFRGNNNANNVATAPAANQQPATRPIPAPPPAAAPARNEIPTPEPRTTKAVADAPSARPEPAAPAEAKANSDTQNRDVSEKKDSAGETIKEQKVAKTEEPAPAFENKSTPPPPEKAPAEAEKKPAQQMVADDDDGERRTTTPKVAAKKADDAPAAKPVENAPAPAKPVAPAPPAPLCLQCLGTGTLPLSPTRIYVRTGSEAVTAATASNAVPWRLCSRCAAKIDPQTLVSTEAARIAASAAAHKLWEEQSGTKLSFAETHYVSLRSTMPESELKIVANALEQLTSLLQQNTQCTLLTQTRPDTEQILIGADKAGYWAFLDALKAQYPKEDFSLQKNSAGFMSAHLACFDAQRNGGMGARSMALYELAEMMMARATDGKAPTWLRMGFASYCENVITKKNLVYAFAYEKNEVHFSENWDNEIKKFASQSKLKTWDQIFLCNAIGMSSLDYLTCYSMVSFFMNTDPKLFPKLVLAFKEGLDSEKAIQKVYSSDHQRMQNMWAQWAMSKQ